MGLEIRRVAAHWQHPKTTQLNLRTGQEDEYYQPMYNQSYIDALNEWIRNHTLWELGEHPDQVDGDAEAVGKYYAEWDGDAPQIAYYRPNWAVEEMTWWQVYETVSEGSPVTPAFETQGELVEHLVVHGDRWGRKPWSYELARSFVCGSGWAPSIAIVNGEMKIGVETIYGGVIPPHGKGEGA